MTTLEVRNLRQDLLTAQLVDEFAGSLLPDSSVTGDGWRVRFERAEPARVGSLSVPVLILSIEGPREAQAVAFLRSRTIRGGG